MGGMQRNALRLIMKAAFDRYSGYGNDAVDLAIWLRRAGVDLTVMPTAILPGLPREFTSLLEVDPAGPKDAVLHFAPPQDLARAPRIGTMPQIAYTMWERTPMAVEDFPDWQVPDEPAFADMYPLGAWDKVIVTCPMNREAFEPVVRGEQSAIDVVPCGITPDDWPVVRRERGGPVRFLMIGMLGGRKNPFALLHTWKRWREDHPEIEAHLHVHTLARALHPAIADSYPDVTLTYNALDRPALVDLYHRHDVLVSTSRGEGNNKPAMEFMATGGTVMATDWSGHQNWLHPECTIPLPGSLVQAESAPWAREFEVDVDVLYEKIHWAATHGSEVRMMGERAAPVIRQSLSWEAVTARMIRSIEEAL